MAKAGLKYSIAGELGKGGFGVVYLLKAANGHKLALKTVDLRKIPEDFRDRAKDEAKILISLNHRHLVHHVNSYIKHPYLCIITEFCAGGDMQKMVSHLGFTAGLPEKLIVCWLMQTSLALNYMHTHNPVVLHRDLKPQNIYVTERGDVRLGDLGLARKLAGPTDFANTQVGTIMYLSPEILSHQPYNSKSDIWSLGQVFYDIAGKKGSDEMGMIFLLLQVLQENKPPLPDHYSVELRKTICSMLTKDPVHRPSAANILASPVVHAFQRDPQRPVDIIKEHARKQKRRPPQIARDLSGMRGIHSAPLRPEEILVPVDAEKLLADIDTGPSAPVLDAAPAAASRPQNARQNPKFSLPGISSNSMILLGASAEAQGAADRAPEHGGGAAAQQASPPDNDTFYDSQDQPEMAEDLLILQIQQCQSECIESLGLEMLEAAYGIIGNVRDIAALKNDLKGLLGDTLYKNYGAKILKLRALEYGLQKTQKRARDGHHWRRSQINKTVTSCDVMLQRRNVHVRVMGHI